MQRPRTTKRCLPTRPSHRQQLLVLNSGIEGVEQRAPAASQELRPDDGTARLSFGGVYVWMYRSRQTEQQRGINEDTGEMFCSWKCLGGLSMRRDVPRRAIGNRLREGEKNLFSVGSASMALEGGGLR